MKLDKVVRAYKEAGGGLWYLASPYSKYPAGPEQAYRDVTKVAAALMKRGIHVFCPITHSHPLAVIGGLPLNDHDFWLPHDRYHMERCEGVIVACMDTWETSTGVTWEIQRFEKNRRPVLYLEVDDLLCDEEAVKAQVEGWMAQTAEIGRLPADAGARKDLPMASGLLDYFPDALAYVAGISKAGNDQHNPGQPIHWARGKSMDHADCVARHLIDRGTVDVDGKRHSGKMAWRSLALLQEELEAAHGLPMPRGAKVD